MRIVHIDVKLAFEDCIVGPQCADYCADRISEVCFEALEAEVASVRVMADQGVEYTDFSLEGLLNDDDIEAWQARAREEFARLGEIQG